MVIVLTLIIVPDAEKPLGVGETCDIDASISRPCEALHLRIAFLQAVVCPLLNKVLPLVVGVQEELLLWRDQRPMRHLCRRNLYGRPLRGSNDLPIGNHAATTFSTPAGAPLPTTQVSAGKSSTLLVFRPLINANPSRAFVAPRVFVWVQ